MRATMVTAAAMLMLVLGAGAQVSREAVAGVENFSKVDATVACAGAMTRAGVAEVQKLGYRAIINLRQASEPGADIEAEAAAAKEAGLNYVHLPLNAASPDPAVVYRFLKAVTDPDNQPVVIHCHSGNRAAAMWMIKRMMVDGWDADRASAEAATLGLTNPTLKAFALEYVKTHQTVR